MAEAAPRQQKTETLSTLYDGKLRLERRNGAPWIFARTHLQGKYIVRSTREQTLPAATKIATDWYLDLRDRTRRGEHLRGRAFAASAEAFLEHADQVREVSEGQRRNYRQKWALLKPHFQDVKITDRYPAVRARAEESCSFRQPLNSRLGEVVTHGTRPSAPR